MRIPSFKEVAGCTAIVTAAVLLSLGPSQAVAMVAIPILLGMRLKVQYSSQKSDDRNLLQRKDSKSYELNKIDEKISLMATAAIPVIGVGLALYRVL